MSTDQVIAAALKLPAKRKAQLAEQLLDSLHTEAQRRIDAAWAEEAESRIDAINKGFIRTRPAAEVFRDAKRRAKP